MATATSVRVDVWKLMDRKKEEKKAGDDESDDFDNYDMQEPKMTLSRFEDQITAVKLREDGQVVLAGDKLGNIELIELKQKLVLRNYKNEFKNQVNFLDFSPTKRAFVACSNETSWKYYDISNSDGALFVCQAAHSDNIKQVQFLPGEAKYVISAGQDKYLKLWHIDDEKLHSNAMKDEDDDAEPCKLVSQLALDHTIESFCFMTFGGFKFIVVANSNLLSIVRICTDAKDERGEMMEGSEQDAAQQPYSLKLLQSIHAFQKPIMKVDYDFTRKRVVAGGLDQ